MIAALKSSRVLVIVTTRTPQDSLIVAWCLWCICRSSRLEPRQAAELLQSVSTRSMPDRVNAEIIARADGVPLFIEELSKAVMETEIGS